jgi:hypothetical protein
VIQIVAIRTEQVKTFHIGPGGHLHVVAAQTAGGAELSLDELERVIADEGAYMWDLAAGRRRTLTVEECPNCGERIVVA